MPGSRTIASAGASGVLKLTDAATGAVLGLLLGHTQKIWGVSASADGTTLATASSDGTIKLWDARPPRLDRSLPPLTAREHGSMDFAFTPDGQSVVVARAIGRERFFARDDTPGYLVNAALEVAGFDSKSGARQFQHVLARGMQIYWLSLTREGRFLTVNSPNGEHTVWDVAAGKQLDAIGRFEWGRAGICEARDGGLVIKRPRGKIELVDALSGEMRLVLRGSESWDCVASSPHANLLAVYDGSQLAVWDLATSRLLGKRQVDRSTFERTASAFSPDGTIVAIALPDGKIQLWDARTLKLRATLMGHFRHVHGLAFSPDRTVLVSGSFDGTMKLWDVAAGEELFTRGQWQWGEASPTLMHPSFAPDGRTLGFCAQKESETWLFLVPIALPDDLAKEENNN